MNVVLLGVLGYIALQLLVGAVVARRIRNQDDYLLAGRSLGPVLATLSIFATWFGAETCVGAAGAVYAEGLAGCAADPFGYSLCLLLMGLVLAVPLYRRGLTTIADLFRQRYSVGVERLAVLLMVPTSVLWAAAQVRAFGQILSASSTLPVDWAIAIAAGIVIVYTVSGGLLADAITDLVQGCVLMAGLAIVAVAVIGDAGGLASAARQVAPARLHLVAEGESLLDTINRWAIPICGSLVAQELVSRVLASRSAKVARRSALVASGIYFAFGLIPVGIGLIGATALPNLDEAEQVLPQMARAHLSTVGYVLFAGALASAILSTVDSALLACASLVSHNLIEPFRPGLSEKSKVRSARVGVIVFGVLAFFLALQADGVYGLVEDASAFGSAGIFVVVLFALFGRTGGRIGATSALLVGVLVWIVGNYAFAWPNAYLASLAGALVGYTGGALVDRAGATLPEPANLILAEGGSEPAIGD